MDADKLDPTRINLDEAEKFLTCLDAEAEFFTFQTFDDSKGRHSRRLARILHGTLAEHAATLTELSRRGAGIFVTVNETNGTGRSKIDIIRVRAVWQEDDGDGKPVPLRAHIEVQSSPGKYHRYYLTDGMTPEQHRGVMETMAAEYGSDPQAKDLCRVMRLPGFPHQKGAPFHVHIVDDSGWQPFPVAEVLQAIPPINRQNGAPSKPTTQGAIPDPEWCRIKSAMGAVSSDPREAWLTIGMVLHTTGDSRAFEAWRKWSETSDSYDETAQHKAWASFGSDRGLGLGTLFDMAMKAGWTYQPPTGAATGDLTYQAALDELDSLAEQDQVLAQWIPLLLRVPDLTHLQLNATIDRIIARYPSDLSKRPLQQDFASAKRRQTSEAVKLRAQEEIDDSAGGRHKIRWDPTSYFSMIRAAEHAMLSRPEDEQLFLYADRYCRIAQAKPPQSHAIDKNSNPPPAVPVILPYDDTSMEVRLDRSAAIIGEATERLPERVIAPPQKLLTGLLHNPSPEAPAIHGIEVHPVVLPDGRVLDTEGYDPDTGLCLSFCGAEYDTLRADISASDARHAREYLIEEVFGEFEFAGQMDMANAVTMLLTSLHRRLLHEAPGFLVTASLQGSGKTTLCRMIHIISTGQDMPVMVMSSHGEELEKALMANLMQGVHTLCIDNIPDGFVFNPPALAAMMTSREYSGRVLGETRVVKMPTNALVCATGNNVRLGPDYARRLLPIQLQPSSARPESSVYRHPDVYAHCLKIRRKAIRAAMSISAGYIRDGAPEVGGPSGKLLWDRLVRYPLLWSGSPDPMESFDASRELSPELQGRTALIHAFRECFGSEEATASMIIRAIEDARGSGAIALGDAISEVSDKAHKSSRALGALLRKLVGHPAGDMTMDVRTLDGVARFSVVKRRGKNILRFSNKSVSTPVLGE